MKEFFIGLGLGMSAGLIVGAISVAKNKKLAEKIKEGLSCAEQKIEEAKINIKEKLDESCSKNNSDCDCKDPNCICN